MLQEAQNCLTLYPWLLQEAVPIKRPRLWQDVTREVAEKYGTTLGVLIGYDERVRLAPARQEAWSLIRDEGRLSYPQIGHRFGGRNHTTILAGVRTHRGEITRKRSPRV